jgi:hypothetical protein
MPARSPAINSIFGIQFTDQVNKCGMRRDPSYDAEKLALGRIAILSAGTAILGNVRPLRMHPRCGTIFFSQRRRWFASTKSKLNSIAKFQRGYRRSEFGRLDEICDLRI